MNYDHEAIRKAYPNVKTIADNIGVFDKDKKPVTLDQSKVNKARKELNDAADAVKYKTDRTTNGSTKYASLGDQLDMLYKDMVAGKLDSTGEWAKHIKSVKDANPKP